MTIQPVLLELYFHINQALSSNLSNADSVIVSPWNTFLESVIIVEALGKTLIKLTLITATQKLSFKTQVTEIVFIVNILSGCKNHIFLMLTRQLLLSHETQDVVFADLLYHVFVFVFLFCFFSVRFFYLICYPLHLFFLS